MTRPRSRDPSPIYSVDEATGDITINPRKRLLERLPPTVGRSAAFDDLHQRLAAATELFLHHGDGGRQGVFQAVTSLRDYLTSRGIPHVSIATLEAVAAAIVDADKGRASPIFAPTRSAEGGAPPKGSMQHDFESNLVAVMECCVRHFRAGGKRPFIEPAARLAVKLINESSWPVEVTAKQLVELRERAQQAAKDSPDRYALDEFLSGEPAHASPLEWAKVLLSHEWVNPLPRESA